jgi:quinol monooxygenase YgiN
MLKFKISPPIVLAATTLAVFAPAPLRAETATGEVTVLTIIDVVPNYAMPQNVETASALLAKLAEETQRAPGLVNFKILQDATRSNHFVIVGVWKDMHAFDAYTGADTTKTFRQAFQPRLGGPFDERVYVDLK